MEINPLNVIAANWYGRLSANRARKLDRLWKRFIASLRPKQQELF